MKFCGEGFCECVELVWVVVCDENVVVREEIGGGVVYFWDGGGC